MVQRPEALQLSALPALEPPRALSEALVQPSLLPSSASMQVLPGRVWQRRPVEARPS